MTRVAIRRHGEPPDISDFQPKLDAFNESLTGPHKIVLRWNPTAHLVSKDPEVWEPRWELWVTLEENSHPLSSFARRKGDRYFPGKGWCRFLQTWQYDDLAFAPLDDRLIVELHRRDTWRNRRWFQETIEEVDERVDKEWRTQVREAVRGAESYYRSWDNPFFSPGGSGGDWRWRIR